MTREEAISIMNVIIHMLEPQYDNDRVEEAVDMAIQALEQEPKTGHWVNPYGGNWHCDKCDHEQGRKSNFCPNCGAKMEGEDKE